MKIPTTLTILPKMGFRILNGYGHSVTPAPKEITAKRAWKIQARKILLGWSGVDRVVVAFDDGSDDQITWNQATAHAQNSPVGKVLKEINSRRAA